MHKHHRAIVELYQARFDPIKEAPIFPSARTGRALHRSGTQDYGKLGWNLVFQVLGIEVFHIGSTGVHLQPSQSHRFVSTCCGTSGQFPSARWGLASDMLTVCRDGIPMHPNTIVFLRETLSLRGTSFLWTSPDDESKQKWENLCTHGWSQHRGLRLSTHEPIFTDTVCTPYSWCIS